MPHATLVERSAPAAPRGAMPARFHRGVLIPTAGPGDPRDFLRGIPDGPVSVPPNGPPAGPGESDPAGGEGEMPAVAASDPDLPTAFEEPPVPIFAPEPAYPGIAFEAGIEGTVLVEAVVTREGLVRQVRVRQGNPILAESAAAAVRTWRFRPARWNGKPVTVRIVVPVRFRIE
jgi:protein TonB